MAKTFEYILVLVNAMYRHCMYKYMHVYTRISRNQIERITQGFEHPSCAYKPVVLTALPPAIMPHVVCCKVVYDYNQTCTLVSCVWRRTRHAPRPGHDAASSSLHTDLIGAKVASGSQYMAVHGSTCQWQYMIVHFLVHTDSMLVRTGTSEYKLHGWPAGFCSWNFALLKALISRSVQADTPMHAQTGWFICHPWFRPDIYINGMETAKITGDSMKVLMLTVTVPDTAFHGSWPHCSRGNYIWVCASMY